MNYKILFVLLFFIPVIGYSQTTDTLINKLDSLNIKDSAGKQLNNIDPEAYNAVTKINVPTYFILLGSNFKQQITAPFHFTHKDWKKVGLFALTTGALAFADQPIQRQALELRNSNRNIRVISGHVTKFGGAYEAYTLAAFGLYGLMFKNEKMKTTTLLASQAYLTGAASFTVLKFLTGRQRPNTYDPIRKESRSTFHGPFYKPEYDIDGNKIGTTSFPSGHTTVAFAAATVYAMEYRDKPIVPIIAYSAASLIGISRITENRHWATDVLVGAALGFFTGKQVVNNYHRYARLKSPSRQRNSLTFNVQYSNRTIMPGIVYKFR